MDQNIKLRVSKIDKSFYGVPALQKIDFAVRKGTVHALCGENGAGKSTLMKIIDGIYKPDGGQIFIDEKPVKIQSPIEAQKYGIAMIPQELNFIPESTVAENLFVGKWPVNKFGKIDWKEIHSKTAEFLRRENLSYKPEQKLKSLTVSDIQMLEILKAVSFKASIIVMDEPTSAITQRETKILFDKIKDLRNRGVSVIYISHKMEEVFQIADDITILRDGAVVASKPADEFDLDSVISMMVGRKMGNAYPKETVPIGDTLLEVKDFCSDKLYKNISFNVKKGEIVGFAGLIGAGRTEVMRSVFGLDPYTSGTAKINGKDMKIKSPQESIKQGLAMLSEDRRQFGIIPMRSVEENAVLADLKQVIYGGKAHKSEEQKLVTSFFEKLRVKTPNLETPIQSLSGGNQQKVLLAKWLICNPEVLILDEPTRGIDVGAKFEIYKLMTDIVKDGKGIVMVSSELPELIGMCDRIYIMSRGKITAELERDSFSQETIMKYAM